MMREQVNYGGMGVVEGRLRGWSIVVAEEMERKRIELERVLSGRLGARRQEARVSCCAVSSEWSVWYGCCCCDCYR